MKKFFVIVPLIVAILVTLSAPASAQVPKVRKGVEVLRASEIMGRNFFGVGEAIKFFGVKPTLEELSFLMSQVPFSEWTLKDCKDSHVLVAVFPLSIMEIRERQAKYFYDQDERWYKNSSFANDKGEVSWQLVRKTPSPDSASKTWVEQQALLSNEEKIPQARVMVYTILASFFVSGDWLFEKVYVRTSDVVLDSDSDRVCVGIFDAKGIYVNQCDANSRFEYVGVSSAYKK